MILERVEHPEWLSNTWLAAAGAGAPGVLVDAGGPVEPVLEIIRRHRVRVTHLLLTHHHFDHAGEAGRLARETGAEIVAHRAEIPLLAGDLRPAGAVGSLEDGQVLSSGGLGIRVLHIPGHTAGQAAFVVGEPGRPEAGSVCFTGDTLFRGSIGSTTAPGHTTFADLRRSLLERLLSLPDGTVVAPGHAAPSTIGRERAHNPFLRVMLGADPEGREAARFAGRAGRLVVRARDYDGGTKAWIRFPEGDEDTVPGSRVERAG